MRPSFAEHFKLNAPKALLWTLALAPLTLTAHAKPVINTLESGLYENKEVLEISGSGFSGPPTVILFDNFENGKPGEYVLPESANLGSWNSISESAAKPYYVREASGNTGFLARDLTMPVGSQRPILKLSFGKPYRKVFFSYSVKVPEDNYFPGASSDRIFPDNSSWKFVWLMSGEGLYANDGRFDLAVPSHVGRGSFLIGGNDGNISWISGGGNWWSWHDFNNMSFYIETDEIAPSTTPVLWDFSVINTTTVYQRSDVTDPANFSGTDYQFDKLHVPGWWGNGDTSNFQAIYDNVYVAVGENSRSRVVITDRELISDSTKAVTLPPLSWSNEKIIIDRSLIPDWQSIFIHVYDSKNQSTLVGEKLCPMCPDPVKIQIR